jgi:hypothetical protein
LIRSVFEEDVASRILRIPISRHGGSDFVSWPHNKFGFYTVRSAYNLASTQEFNQTRSLSKRGLSSNMDEEASLWKRLWKITAPGKMKITLWRFVHDCLPSGQQLQRRNILASSVCIHCNCEEQAAHTLLFCQFARDVWEDLKIWSAIKLQRHNFINPKAWLFDFLSRSLVQQMTVLTVAFWHLWEARNSYRNGDTMKNPRSLALQIKAYVDMIELHLRKPVSNHRCETNYSVAKWTPPPEGTVWINVDAALFKPSNRMGVGVVIRNHNGVCLAACSELLSEVTSPELAEALASGVHWLSFVKRVSTRSC